MSISIPKVGLGTYLISNQELKQCIPAALKAGYRHFDTAQVYENEKGLGLSLAESLSDQNISRKNIFITSKVFTGNESWGQPPMSYSETLNSIETSLEKLQVDYLDLFLIHAPFCQNDRVDQWAAMLEIKKLGKAKSIGVCNYNISHIEEIKSAGLPLPEANQIEIHPWCQKTELASYLKQNNISIIAYSSLVPLSNWRAKEGEDSSKSTQMIADGEKSSSIFKVMANKYGVTEAQILLKWAVQKGFHIIPKSTNPTRIEQNIDLDSFEIDLPDLETISSLNRSDVGVAWPSGDPSMMN